MTRPLDTSKEADERYHELLRACPPHERLARADALSRMVRALAVQGIKMRHPNATAHEVEIRLAVRLYGREVARRVYGDIPADAR